jgi:hypothetical protein
VIKVGEENWQRFEINTSQKFHFNEKYFVYVRTGMKHIKAKETNRFRVTRQFWRTGGEEL